MASADTHKEDATVNDLLRVIGKQTVRIAELEAENALLRTRHGVQGSLNTPTKSNLGKISKSNIITRPPESSLQQLSQRHAELLARHERLENQAAAQERKYREAKAIVKDWKVYLEKRLPSSSRSKLLPEHDKGLKGIEVVKPFHQHDGQVSEYPRIPTSPLGEVEATAGDVHGSTLPEHVSGSIDAHKLETATEAVDRSGRVTSSQTTESIDDLEETPRVTIKRESSNDDTPTVVFERRLKRKASTPVRTESPRRIKQESISPGRTLEFDTSSHDSPTLPPQFLQRQETFDLNAVGMNLRTPRKPRFDLHLNQRATPDDSARLRPRSSRKEPSSADGETYTPRVTSPKRIPDVRNVPKNKRSTIASWKHDNVKAQHRGSPFASALQQLSVNVPTGRPIRRGLTAPKHDVNEADAKIKVEPEKHVDDANKRVEVIERSNEQQPYVKTHEEAAEARLTALLADHTPARIPLAGEIRASATKNRKEKEQVEEPTPIKIADKRPASSTDGHKARGETRGSYESPPPPHGPEKRALRSRSLSSLQLEDFKINPHYLGTDFAYVDTTMRGREQRRTMHTCTRPDCCGETFRQVIEIGGTSVSGKSDDVALEEFLGPAWEQLMQAYDPEKRRDVLVEAHVHCFAREHGKHRHAFQRRNTPPGFWRTDMPTTQEEVEDRVRARQVERQKVEERWREAMRDGGRWMFKDE